MQNIRLEIEYDGMNFYGWEIQPHKRTVRGVLESLLESILQEKIKLVCGARTDTGVHAISQIANFKTETKITPRKIKQALLQLPQDVCVKSVKNMPLNFNAHFDAVSRTYLYKIVIGKSPTRRYGIWEYKFPLDIERIKSVLPLFLGKHRFDFFASKDEGECDIKTLKIIQKKNDLVFEIRADHFLRKMIRLIIGTLTEFGRGYLSEKDIQDAIDCKKNARKFLSAPPQGLYLKEIKYK
ncbi:MAG: tRNA pseudouridine(38-40) synthase TruA [bacterium]|nr:tRNA pseudouridine(38-40) synthase TruA [bacterium]